MAKSLLLSSLLLASNQASAESTDPCPAIREGESCPAGCFLLETEIKFPFAKRQCTSVGYGYISKDNDNTRQKCPPGTFSNTLNAQVCQQCDAGAYASAEGSQLCDLCPSGYFSAIPGSDFCRPCLNDYYDQDGANGVEYWEGEFYCVYVGSPTSSSSPTESPSAAPTELEGTPSPTTAPSPVPTAGRSEAPTTASSMPSEGPTTADERNIVVSSEEQFSQANATSSVCGDLEGHFEWHGHCKQCPSKIEEGLYPFLIVFLFVSLITVLQSVVPLCSTSTVWAGMEYLQVLYLVSLCGISWSPLAKVVFENVIPVFALDFSANFSVQCLFGWPKEYDQIFVIALPLVFWLAMTAASTLSAGRLVSYKSGLRWLAVYMYFGFASLMQTSRDATDLASVFSTLFSHLASTTWYAAIAGITGLVFYGLVFPYWLHRALARYYKVVVLGDEGAEEEDDVETQATCSCLQTIRRKTEGSHASLFLTLGIFPSVREGASWWTLFWLLRKMAFLVLVAFFPSSPFLLLVALLNMLFFSEVFQRCKKPFPNECEERLGNKWYHSDKVDTVLQLCAVAIVGLSCLVVGSDGKRSQAQDLTLDILLIVLLAASVLFWLTTIGFASRYSCEDCPRFATQAAEFLTSKDDEDDDDEASSDSGMQEISLDDPRIEDHSAEIPKPVSNRKDWKPTILSSMDVPNFGARNKVARSNIEEEIVLNGRGHHAPPPPAMFRQYSAASFDDNTSIGRGDEATIVEEIWIDQETGREVNNHSGRQFVDAETGMRIA